MGNVIRHLRGTDTEHSSYVGEKGVISLVTAEDGTHEPTGELRVHDGKTSGGIEPVRKVLNVEGDAPIYACRGWINFNSQLNINLDVPEGSDELFIRSSSNNISNVIYNSVGDFTVNFKPNVGMLDENYSVVATIKTNENTKEVELNTICIDQLTTSSFKVYSGNTTSFVDPSMISLHIFR